MNHPLATLFDQFLRERTYLKNVTPRTLIWYRVAFKNYSTAFPDAVVPTRRRCSSSLSDCARAISVR